MKYLKKFLPFILCAALLAAFVPTNAFGASSSYDLDFDQSAWLYNSTYDVYYQTYADEYLEDCENYTASSLLNISSQYRRNMYNPMYYVCQDYAGYGTSSIAPHWRINTGITQSDTSVTVETNLYLALSEDISDGTVSDVDFAMHWAQGHTEAERAGADSDECFIAWLEECISADESAETAITSVSLTKGDTLTVTVETSGEIDGIILAVGYADGIVIDFAEVTDATASLSSECETVKIFIWSTLPSLYPLCEYAEITP